MALLLYGRLPTIFGLSKTDTAAVVGEVLHKNERTIRRWVDDFMSNGGEFSDSQQGHYVRNNTLMSNEREQESMCGKMLLHEGDPTLQPEPSVSPRPRLPPQCVSGDSTKVAHDLGFDVLQMSKGVFIEHPDVVESREKFLRKMTECGFVRPDNAPTKEAAQALPHT